jgi:hypothetical protein
VPHDLIDNLLDDMSIFAVKQDQIEADRKGQRGQYAKHSPIVMRPNLEAVT